MRIKEVGYIVERLADRFRDLGGQMAGQEASHKTALTELRASFNARTGADEKIIEGLRIQAQDMRAEMERLREDERKAYQAGDALRAEVAQLKTQLNSPTPKHPVKVGEWVKRLTPSPMTPAGGVAKVTDVFEVLGLAVKIERPDGIKGTWWAKSCEPCDPPEATHDTEAGKAAAAALKTEPVADELKVGDIIEVVSATHRLYTEHEDIGRRGIVTVIYGMRLSLSAVPGHELPISGIVGKCDVRKVTT